MLTNTTIDTKGSRSIFVKKTGHEELRITVMFWVLTDARKLTPFVVLKRKDIPKETRSSGVIFECNEKGWMSEEFMVKCLRKDWGRSLGAVLKKRGMLV
jgi:hypothetical protein